MGQKWTQTSYLKMKGTTAVGSGTECPMCGEPFSRKHTYDAVSFSSFFSNFD